MPVFAPETIVLADHTQTRFGRATMAIGPAGPGGLFVGDRPEKVQRPESALPEEVYSNMPEDVYSTTTQPECRQRQKEPKEQWFDETVQRQEESAPAAIEVRWACFSSNY